MREFVIKNQSEASGSEPQQKSKPKKPAVVMRQVEAPSAPRKPVQPVLGELADARPRKRGEKIFAIHYEGKFAGFFEAEAELTPREAFLRVAQEMASANELFNADKLELYKLVHVKNAHPTNGDGIVRGRLRRVDEPRDRSSQLETTTS